MTCQLLKSKGVFVVVENINVTNLFHKIIGIYENEEEAKQQTIWPNGKVFGPIPFHREKYNKSSYWIQR